MVGWALEELRDRLGARSPTATLALQTIAANLLASKPLLVLLRLERVVRGLLGAVPRLPIDLSSDHAGSLGVRRHRFVPSEAINPDVRRKRLRPLVAPRHRREHPLGLRAGADGAEPVEVRLRGLDGRIHLRAPRGVRILVRLLQPLQVRPRDVARPLLGLGREGFVATDLLHLELALATNACELGLHVGPPGLSEGVPLAGGHEVRRELLPGLALAGGPRAIRVHDDVVALVEQLEHSVQRLHEQEVRIHVKTSLMEEHGRPHEVRLGGGVRQPEVLLRNIRHQLADVRVVDEDHLGACGCVLSPSLQVEGVKRIGTIRVVPVGVDVVQRCRSSRGRRAGGSGTNSASASGSASGSANGRGSGSASISGRCGGNSIATRGDRAASSSAAGGAAGSGRARHLAKGRSSLLTRGVLGSCRRAPKLAVEGLLMLLGRPELPSYEGRQHNSSEASEAATAAPNRLFRGAGHGESRRAQRASTGGGGDMTN
mmetsp:Transcript_144115/g.461372  ORF Transcript_144115/g.461372 Transcript_144115/m.461372 type:complete len:487 (-) Transcript_144115:78-1538(-)